jgi:quinol monooxygenase YgiN
MPLTRLYQMKSRRQEGDALEAALKKLAGRVISIPGCQGVELMRDSQNHDHFVFVERWTSPDLHKSGAQMLGRDALCDVEALLSEPPIGCSLNAVLY